MQQGRRDFAKKAAIVTAGVATLAGTSALASDSQSKESGNGVVKGVSSKKEILYKKTRAWEDYYKSAK